MMFKKNIVYILPHHDDELFAIPKITNDLQAGHTISFFFLMKSERRLNESRKFLGRLGIDQKNIISIGEKLDTQDGFIHLKLEEIYLELNSQLSNRGSIDEIVSTAYEGGHNDHDVASTITRVLALDFKAKMFEFYLYNGIGKKGKFYNVAFPMYKSSPEFYPYNWKDKYTVFIAPFFFLSQLRAMLGLWPFLFIKSFCNKSLVMDRVASPLKLSEHSETPLYEKWGRIEQKNIFPILKHFLYTRELSNNDKHDSLTTGNEESHECTKLI